MWNFERKEVELRKRCKSPKKYVPITPKKVCTYNSEKDVGRTPKAKYNLLKNQ
jgi:hypothetical protein